MNITLRFRVTLRNDAGGIGAGGNPDYSAKNISITIGQADDDIDSGDPGAGRQTGNAGHLQLTAADILQLAAAFMEEMMVVVDIGVEIGAPGLHHHFAQQPGLPELVQRIIDRGQGDLHPRLQRFPMQLFGCDMAVPGIKQQLGQGQPLAGGPQPGFRQTGGRSGAAAIRGVWAKIVGRVKRRGHICHAVGVGRFMEAV